MKSQGAIQDWFVTTPNDLLDSLMVDFIVIIDGWAVPFQIAGSQSTAKDKRASMDREYPKHDGHRPFPILAMKKANGYMKSLYPLTSEVLQKHKESRIRVEASS